MEGLLSSYHGEILIGDYSHELKMRLKEEISAMVAFDLLGSPAIPYISAWKEHQKVMWYEFASENFLKIMNCTLIELPTVFRKSVRDRRIYTYKGSAEEIHKETVSGRALHEQRKKIREEGTQSRFVEAVYKIAPGGKKILWLKDQAVIEEFEPDGIFLSKGCLTIVTKEMEAEAARERAERERLQREKLQGVLEMAGAVCHELNQPVMAMAGYADIVSMGVSGDDVFQEKLAKLKTQATRVGEITRKLMKITRYKTKDYATGEKIIDIDASITEK